MHKDPYTESFNGRTERNKLPQGCIVPSTSVPMHLKTFILLSALWTVVIY